MAHDDRTEKATPKRRQESRRKGQVARSSDLNGAVVMIVGLFAIGALGPAVVDATATAMRDTFARIAHPDELGSAAGLSGLEHAILQTLLATIGPLAGACLVAGVLVNVVQVGWRPTAAGLKPDPRRLDPIAGFKNTFGSRVGFETAKALAKVAAVGIVVALALLPQLTHLGASVGATPAALGSLMRSSAMSIAQRAALAYLAIAIIDFAWQRRRNERQLRMTKQEVKDEMRQHGLPPEVKSALRRRQMQAARARMMAAVPQADVVVTNPTHYAVALRYDGSRTAPEVVAKGKDLVAAQIRRIAAENDVPVITDPPLARALHGSVEIGQLIPEELYEAVAQVLAFVYRVARRRRVA